MIWDRLDLYQQRAVEWAMGRDGASLFMEQGTGKTWVTAGIVEQHMARGMISALVVVPLANLVTTWVRMLEQLEGLVLCRTWDEFKAARGGHRLLLLNYEKVRPVIRRLRTVEWSLVVYDESQRLKGRGSKQSKDAARLDASHRVILSGTPIEQCPQDLWAQFRFAMPEVFGSRWKDFESRWMKKSGYMGYELKFRMEKLPKFLRLVEPHILRIRKSDVLDLPPLRYIRVPVPLLGDQARAYREITRDMVTTVGGREVTCDMAITQLVRQQQICGGFVRADASERERERAATRARETGRDARVSGPMLACGRAKLRRVRAIVRREEKPLVIFCQYREEMAALGRMLEGDGLRVGTVSGRQKRKRTGVIEKFQRGELDALVCQIRAGGVGLDLQQACVVIFYSATWSWIDFDQAVSRVHRRGQTRPVRVYLVFAQDTVDAKVYEALLLKKSVTTLILDRRRTHMAKKDKADKAEATKAKPTPPPQPPKPKYGVPELAEVLGTKPSSVRVRLRNAGIKKSGKLYGWDSKSEMMEVANKLKAKKAKADEGDDEEDDEE